MILHVTVRRFSCRTPDCPRTIFAESINDIAPSRARTTSDLTDAHVAIGFAAGGEPGSRLAKSLGMPTSPDTLLRRVLAVAHEPGPPPRYIGIDDWACKKGQRYGTILIDLERQRVIDLLPGRDGESLTKWLQKNPQVEVITRDRWPAYAKAASVAAPQATQVADRWHLLKNLREAVENLFARLSPEIRSAASSVKRPRRQNRNQRPARPNRLLPCQFQPLTLRRPLLRLRHQAEKRSGRRVGYDVDACTNCVTRD
jgi:transposase